MSSITGIRVGFGVRITVELAARLRADRV